MARFIERLVMTNGENFIHTILKLIAAILHHNARLVQRLITSINIGNAAHTYFPFARLSDIAPK